MADTYVTCSCCTHRFTKAESTVACGKCSLLGIGGCKKLRCPQCGYEMPPPSCLEKAIRRWFGKKED